MPRKTWASRVLTVSIPRTIRSCPKRGFPKSMCKLLIATALLATSLNAAFLSEHGKTFHASRSCMALSRAKVVLEASEADAKAHNLKPCGICYRAKTTKKPATGNGSWAKQEGK